ncbi:hypothetical protein [Scytonema hofmannii]|uniref:hypothetical protein n=1 Tax=Scytonema hofmannii TaxID=34078 RepID=UPI001314565C|nr:hypothetical protein [Scytonema hofmannii]
MRVSADVSRSGESDCKRSQNMPHTTLLLKKRILRGFQPMVYNRLNKGLVRVLENFALY